METWKQGKAYGPGAVVKHNDNLYQKLDDGDNSPPDDIAGGWEPVSAENNLAEFEAIEASFLSYEERKAKYQADVLAKLKAAGLDPAAVQAVLNA
jgi:hypothetical protein